VRGTRFIIGAVTIVIGLGFYSNTASVGAEQSGGESEQRACLTVASENAFCNADILVDSSMNPMVSTGPTGLVPDRIKSIYNFPTSLTAGSGKTIAIVDAYDDPTALKDLNVFSSQFGLPTCSEENHCFSKVNQNGDHEHLPQVDPYWAVEISLDIQWAHAIAPGAKILLVEARSTSLNDLVVAERYATSHADYVSNSWGAAEFAGERRFDEAFNSDNASIFVSAGDGAGVPSYPATSPNVIAVGGTTLHFTNHVFTSETGWIYSGGGCSLYENALSVQRKFPGYSCDGKKSTPDVALVGDPFTGVSVYDSTPIGPNQLAGWFQIGGTSASTPIFAGRAAAFGGRVNAKTIYGDKLTFRDIVSGGPGNSCAVGFDLCSGRGAWIG
jgi:subtilase family serine protease